MRHLLVVDEERAICDVVKMALEADATCRVSRAATAFDAVSVLRRDRPHGAIIDFCFRSPLGLTITSQALSLGVPVLLTTADLKTREALRANGVPFLAKPYHIRDVVKETHLLLEQARERHAQATAQLARLAANIAELRELTTASRIERERLRATLRRLDRKS